MTTDVEHGQDLNFRYRTVDIDFIHDDSKVNDCQLITREAKYDGLKVSVMCQMQIKVRALLGTVNRSRVKIGILCYNLKHKLSLDMQ